MRYTLHKNDDYSTSRWMGGTTTEFAIFPDNTNYLDRNFIWRLSSANIDVDESNFSSLPDYDRVIMVLEGEVVLSYEGERVARLKSLEQDRFDGAWKTKSFGKIKDFNLMVRKGCEGYLDLIMPESKSVKYESTQESTKNFKTHALYCKEGYFVVSANGESHMVSQGELFVMEGQVGEEPEYALMGEGIVIRAQIFYDDMKSEVGPEIIPSEKGTFDDFKKCIFLANTQFRGAKYIFKSLKRLWYDEALSSAIKKVEQFYLTFIAFFAGILAITMAAINLELTAGIMAVMVLIWVLLDCLVVSPLIYMPFMPKPIAKHIKDIDKLTPYEERVRALEVGQNTSTEKLLNKYKNTGKNLGK